MHAYQVKGSGLQHLEEVWRKLLTEEEFARAAAACPPEAMKLILHPPLPMTWVDGHLTAAFPRVVSQQLGNRGLRLVEESGAQLLERDLKGIYKMLMRVVSVDFAVARANSMYGTYIKGSGTIAAERRDSRTLTIHAVDNADLDEANMWFIGGTTIGVLRAAGAKNPRITERIRTRTGFDFIVEYDP